MLIWASGYLFILLLKLSILFYHLVPLQKQGKTACLFSFFNLPFVCQRKPAHCFEGSLCTLGHRGCFEPFVHFMREKALPVFSLGTPKEPKLCVLFFFFNTLMAVLFIISLVQEK